MAYSVDLVPLILKLVEPGIETRNIFVIFRTKYDKQALDILLL